MHQPKSSKSIKKTDEKAKKHTLSNPAIFLFSAKNSAGDSAKTQQPNQQAADQVHKNKSRIQSL